MHIQLVTAACRSQHRVLEVMVGHHTCVAAAAYEPAVDDARMKTIRVVDTVLSDGEPVKAHQDKAAALPYCSFPVDASVGWRNTLFRSVGTRRRDSVDCLQG